MIKKNYKGKCVKKAVSKSKEVCRTYNNIQTSYLDALQKRDDITEIKCNIPLDDSETKDYTTDFLCIKLNGDYMVRDCVFRNLLTKPMTVKLLDLSREYWLKHGVNDWGIVTNAEK